MFHTVIRRLLASQATSRGGFLDFGSHAARCTAHDWLEVGAWEIRSARAAAIVPPPPLARGHGELERFLSAMGFAAAGSES
jgi:hypothetical protein